MGIQGLLPFLKRSSRPVKLSEFKGKTAAVDVYCWLHKGAFSCAEKLVKGEPTDGYLIYVMKQVNLLLSFDIKPILVFDGCHLPAKEGTESKRRENRAKNRKKAKELLREGKVKEARECFQRCVDVTSSMAHEVIKACRAQNVDAIVAPYEADAQLAFFNHQGIADIVITEDSDLVLFGCNKIIFKIDSNGGGVLVEKEKLHLSMNIPRDKFDFLKFRNMCILSGCDYLPSLHGIGLAKASRFFAVTSNPDVFQALCKLPANLKMHHLEVTLEYRKGFMKAIDTVLHQLIFDPFDFTLKPLTPYPVGSSSENFPYCGEFIGHAKALQIALGNIDVQTGEVIDNYDPLNSERAPVKSTGWQQRGVVSNHVSIWDPEFKNKKSLLNIIKETCTPKLTMRGKECTIEVHAVKRKRVVCDLKNDVETATDDYLQTLYCKKIKSDISAAKVEDSYGNFENADDISATFLPPKQIQTVCQEELKNTADEDPIKENDSDKEIGNKLSLTNGVVDDAVELHISNSENEKISSVAAVSPTKPQTVVSRNPFARKTRREADGSDRSTQGKFGALSKFSEANKSSPIVLSRYFKSTKENATGPKSDQGHNGKANEIEIKDSRRQVIFMDDSHSPKSPLKPKNDLNIAKDRSVNSQSDAKPVRGGVFNWEGGLSRMFAYTKKKQNTDNEVVFSEQSAEESDNPCPPSPSWIHDTPPSSQLSETYIPRGVNCKTHSETQTEEAIIPGRYQKIKANGFTPPDEYSSFEAATSPILKRDSQSFSLKKNSPSGKSVPSFSTPRCRVSGLRKTSTPSPKQLNLKEMFAFRKEVAKMTQ